MVGFVWWICQTGAGCLCSITIRFFPGRESIFLPEIFDDFDDVVFHLDGEEVRERGEHRADVFVGPVQRLAVVTHLVPPQQKT